MRTWTIAHEDDLLHHPYHQELQTHLIPCLKRISIKHPHYPTHAFVQNSKTLYSPFLDELVRGLIQAVDSPTLTIAPNTFEIRNFRSEPDRSRMLECLGSTTRETLLRSTSSTTRTSLLNGTFGGMQKICRVFLHNYQFAEIELTSERSDVYSPLLVSNVQAFWRMPCPARSAFELTTAGVTIAFWIDPSDNRTPPINVGVWIKIFLLSVVVINICGVKGCDKVEFIQR